MNKFLRAFFRDKEVGQAGKKAVMQLADKLGIPRRKSDSRRMNIKLDADLMLITREDFALMGIELPSGPIAPIFEVPFKHKPAPELRPWRIFRPGAREWLIRTLEDTGVVVVYIRAGVDPKSAGMDDILACPLWSKKGVHFRYPCERTVYPFMDDTEFLSADIIKLADYTSAEEAVSRCFVFAGI